MPNNKKNPRQMYAVPPFKNQYQKWPGLSNKMNPRPDCGETSYIGHEKLKKYNTLITGGDSGIGRAVVIAYAREGANVVFNYLPDEQSDADDVISLLRSEGLNVIGIPGDLSSEEFCIELVNTAVSLLGSIDVLVNCAARQNYTKHITQITTDQFDKIFKVNVYALFWLTKEAVKYMSSGSVILNTTSGQAQDPLPFLLDYASTKGAISTWTKCLARQLANKGIRVNAISPGPFWTPLPVSGGFSKKDVSGYGEESPLGRPGQPVEACHLYVFLACNDASYVSGSIWGVDGGKGQT